MTKISGKNIVIIIEGFPVPLFKILMQQAIALQQQGAHVVIISPKLFGLTKSFEIVDFIEIMRYPLLFEADSAAGFFFEYLWTGAWQFFYLFKLSLRRKIHAIQGCTPPDLVFIPALPFKALGTKYCYYQLDLNPELYLSKYKRKDIFYNALILFERLTFHFADVAIVANESFKKIALSRGKMKPERVTVVRSAPDLSVIKPAQPDFAIKKGKRFLVGYLGVICEQDSVDTLISIISLVIEQRNDVHFAIVGDGPEMPAVQTLVDQMDLRENITFFGMIHDQNVLCSILSTCDVCVNPDKQDEFTDKITTIKLMEYMAVGKPIVQFDLTEAKYTAQHASLYAENGNIKDFAEKISLLLDDENRRAEMGSYGYKRITEELSWDIEREKFISLYNRLLQ